MAHCPLEGGLQLWESRKRKGGTREHLVSAFPAPIFNDHDCRTAGCRAL